MLSDQDLAAALESLPGERITAGYMESRIKETQYFRPYLMTLCTIVLDNGFMVTGEAACVDPANYDAAIGNKLAYDNAFRKLWPFFGFLLAEKRYQNSKPCTNPAARAAEDWYSKGSSGTPAEPVPKFTARCSLVQDTQWIVVENSGHTDRYVARFYDDDAEIRARAYAEACNAGVASEQAAEEEVARGPAGGPMPDNRVCAALHTHGLSFGGAIARLKDGAKVARQGWNGKGMWLVLIRAGNAIHRSAGSTFDMQDCIGMKTAQNNMQPGWLASQADMLADDWMVVG